MCVHIRNALKHSNGVNLNVHICVCLNYKENYRCSPAHNSSLFLFWVHVPTSVSVRRSCVSCFTVLMLSYRHNLKLFLFTMSLSGIRPGGMVKPVCG